MQLEAVDAKVRQGQAAPAAVADANRNLTSGHAGSDVPADFQVAGSIMPPTCICNSICENQICLGDGDPLLAMSKTSALRADRSALQ